MTDEQINAIDKFIDLWFDFLEQSKREEEAKKKINRNNFHKTRAEWLAERTYKILIIQNMSISLQGLKKIFDIPISFNLGQFKPFYSVVKDNGFKSMDRETQINKICHAMEKAYKETHNG